ncbi:MAG: hypothetical protein B6245_09095 [Desulfobacteraceae bacterium 4572_88]|nr:MAG: hypothetical protein B6245_09095 [Desulfobacteraceae bacterium 4572_88]
MKSPGKGCFFWVYYFPGTPQAVIFTVLKQKTCILSITDSSTNDEICHHFIIYFQKNKIRKQKKDDILHLSVDTSERTTGRR